jgi:hypothetical protein
MNKLVGLPAAVLTLCLGACGASSGSSGAQPAGHPASTTPAAAANPFVGTWQTPSLPTRTWAATFRSAGGSATEARDFVDQLGGGSGTTRRITLRASNSTWVQLEQADENTPQVGYNAPYTANGTLVRLEGQCQIGYRVTLHGTTMKVHVLYDRPESNPDCGPNDLKPQRAIWETATFTRVS